MKVGVWTHSVTVLLGNESAGSTWWRSMLLQTTFLSPLFERSSKDLQSDEPAELPPSSTTTDHHRRTGPISAARRRQCLGAEPELVPSGHAMRNGSEIDTRLQPEPPPGSCWAQSVLLPPFLEGFPRFLLCPPLLSFRSGSPRWSFPPGSASQRTSSDVFLCWLPLGLRFSRFSPPTSEALKADFHSVESNFSRQNNRKRDRGKESRQRRPDDTSTAMDALKSQQRGVRLSFFSASRSLRKVLKSSRGVALLPVLSRDPQASSRPPSTSHPTRFSK